MRPRTRSASTRWGEPCDFTVEHEDGRVRLVTTAVTVSLWLDPFRLDVHRADGTPVVETAADEDEVLLDLAVALAGPDAG